MSHSETPGGKYCFFFLLFKLKLSPTGKEAFLISSYHSLGLPLG